MRRGGSLSFAAVLALAACAAPKPVTQSGPLIAVLPFSNFSNNIGAPEKARAALMKEMGESGLRLADPKTMDAALRELGISEGGQLRALETKDLAKAVSADIACRGTVEDFGFKSVVAVSQRRVTLRLACTDLRDGKSIFEGQRTGINSTAGLDAVGEFAINVAGKIVHSVKESGKRLVGSETAGKAADMTDVVADVDLNAELLAAVRGLVQDFMKR